MNNQMKTLLEEVVECIKYIKNLERNPMNSLFRDGELTAYTHVQEIIERLQSEDEEELANTWATNPKNCHPADSYIAKQAFLAGLRGGRKNIQKR